MANLALNRNTSGAVLSPYHPGNIVRYRKLQDQMDKQKTLGKNRYAAVQDIDDLEADWRRIEAELHVSVHQSFSWVRAWVRNKKVNPLFIVGYVGGKIEFILPLEISKKFGVTTAHLIATEQSNLNFALCSTLFLSTCGMDFVDHLQKEIKSVAPFIDVIVLDRMRMQLKDKRNPFESILTTKNQNASFQLPLLDNFDDTLAQLNRKRRRKKFRNTEKRINAVGGYTYTIANSLAENEKILTEFFRQKSKRLKSQGLPNVFEDNELMEFFKEVCSLENQEIGSMELHAIVLKGETYDGQILAISAITPKRDHAICQFSSFNEEINAELDCSPGEFLFYLAIQNFNQREFRKFDFGIGDQPYKRSWCTECDEHFDGTISFTLFGQAYAYLHRKKTDLKRHIKSSQRLHKIAAKMRSLRA